MIMYGGAVIALVKMATVPDVAAMKIAIDNITSRSRVQNGMKNSWKIVVVRPGVVGEAEITPR